MKLIKKVGLLILLTVVFASCRTSYRGLTTNENHHQTQVVLSENNYRIVKYVEGDASARYVFSFGGNGSERGLLARARENMLRNAGLIGTSRAVINETVERRVKDGFFTTEVRYIVSAYVIEFFNPETDTPPEPEESTYAEYIEKPRTPTVVTQGVTAGVTLQADEDDGYGQISIHKPGFHLGYKLEFNKPDIKYLYWGTQLNFAYLNEKYYNSNILRGSEHTLVVEIPFLIGVKIPITENFKWYINGGPSIGLFVNDYTSYSAEYPQGRMNNGLDTEPSVGAELYSGFQLGKHWQLNAGHRWHIGLYEYDYSKISLSYLF